MPAETHKETQPWTVRKSINEALHANDLPDLDEKEEMQEEEAESIELGVPVDVFDHCHRLAENGDVVSYKIYCNNQLKATKPHPYSWDELQREFGAGHYRVEAKSERTKRFLKQQSNFVADPIVKPEKVSTAEAVADAVRAAVPPPVDPFDQMTKMATLLRSVTPPPPAPIQDNSSSNMLSIMQTMMNMQNEAQKSTQQMILEMQKSNREMIEKMSENQAKTLEKLEAKLVNTGSEKKGLDSLQLINLLQQAEERGKKNYLMLDEMAERKAARMSGGGEDKEPESATDKLVKSVLPAITAALSAPKPAQQVQLPVRPVQARPPRPVPVVPNPPAPRAPGSGPKAPVAPVVMPKLTKDQILEKLFPVVLPRLIAADSVKTDPVAVETTQKEAASDVVTALRPLGITLPSLLQIVSQGDIIDIATSASLPVEAHTWLKGFYANLVEMGSDANRPVNAGEPKTAVGK